ncbi:MAG: anacyclamide/piricyclamide family prenylated cyclic peptide [Microcystis aeruginosa L111-01]|jgi:prenylated cyclic peptide (anacyclamide/piricyclamide family)|nr:anacyclamide/piricyclamide family prenylated cyclic peptide [Microcystis aeruginosa W13-16]NCQ81125.1 anacyclamide/piricyclamide family prenylated cyclic peptide [Microcystis aeruginosa W13-15]NCR20244.1 anacyclamide/piricyclamide family prenylated cyclic peptide [Microcystis aeruginosa LL13-03]NCR24847.1 anacyclamide/piricyclamide family prenylated cyclic peptide [Microcystis aeruginosa L111-01]NCR38272.1 anacyclamide/piricyclamide family prenylated cyclic peptide [Microcystis aeruginosa S1
MKTKKLTPRNSAPVQREINTTSSEGGTGLYNVTPLMRGSRVIRTDPFAGDDAE